MKAAFLKVVLNGERGRCLQESLARVDHIDPQAFRAIPSSPFAYWASEDVRGCFARHKSLTENGVEPRVGLQTSNDFRFIRIWFEISSTQVRTRWFPFAKGGEHSPYYASLPLVVTWSNGGEELKAFAASTPGTTHWSRKICNSYQYFRPGLTWPIKNRATFKPWPLPTGCIFAHVGSAAFVARNSRHDLAALQAVMSSSVFTYFLRTMAGWNFEVGMLQAAPLPSDLLVNGITATSGLADLAHRGWSLVRSLDTSSEVSHAFVVPAVLQVAGDTFGSRVAAWGERVAGVEVELAGVQFEIDESCFELYGISDEDRRAITYGFGVSDSDDAGDDSDGEDAAESEVVLDPVGLAAGLVSWAVGVAAGRFDVRLATGEREWPVEPDPFDRLPVCSPGMLTGDDGLPVVSLPGGYSVLPSAVLVDDPGHELDLTARVRSVFDVVFGDQADVWWSEVGDTLDSRNGVEGWLRRGFFDQHLKTYSKSRRKAPVMWPIGTRSGSYRVWLYAHKVTGDTLFRVLGDVVEPKLAGEQRRLSDLTQEFGPSPAASQRRTLEAQQSLVDELIGLRDELRAVAPLWHPDLNDGIVLVLAPLWGLFAHHRAWSKELRDRWARLVKGEYDWAQLAMHIWPERVIHQCAEDRSLAIAHGLESVFWSKDEENPDKWHRRQTPTTSIVQLIADRAKPTIHTARTHPTP